LTAVGASQPTEPGSAPWPTSDRREGDLGSRLNDVLDQTPRRGWSVAEATVAIYGPGADKNKARKETVRTSLRRKVDRGGAC